MGQASFRWYSEGYLATALKTAMLQAICWSASATCCAWPSNGGENEITLQSELEFVGKYLEIEQTRFHDRLKVHMDVPPDLLAVYVPSLALQPLVENAIKHGISVDSAAGRLEIAARRHNGRVWLCVRDDGPGPAPGSRLRFGVGLTMSSHA
jgi:LytS/YehU family sensor histidine kinase